MFKLIMKVILLLIIFAGIIMIYDSRILTKKYFSFGDQNEATSGMKILGFIIASMAGIILYFNM